MNTTLELTFVGDGYYRSFCDINESGYVWQGGSAETAAPRKHICIYRGHPCGQGDAAEAAAPRKCTFIYRGQTFWQGDAAEAAATIKRIIFYRDHPCGQCYMGEFAAVSKCIISYSYHLPMHFGATAYHFHHIHMP